jgi:folate-dependent phosphoribosylglycinamide formyltransferase PurN
MEPKEPLKHSKIRIVIVGQEEPVYMGPFLRELIDKLSDEVILLVIAGTRGAGNHPSSFLEYLKQLYTLWLIMEPWGFMRGVFIRGFYRLLSFLGPLGRVFDKRSLRAKAKENNIPSIQTDDLNSKKFIDSLKSYKPDIVINQSELLIKKETLDIPKIGFINRHASLLPDYRGRLASFWSHASINPVYATTIHFVNEDIDAGPIIKQMTYDLDPCFSYAHILDILFKKAPELMIEALNEIKKPDFKLTDNNYKDTRTCLFPTVEQAREYRKMMKQRRQKSKK